MARTTRAGNSGWGVDVVFSPKFLEYVADKGVVLAYVADHLLDVINKRTDEGLDSVGQPFAPYRRRRLLNDDGTPARDASGRYVEVEDPRSLVTLRSTQDVPQGRRMRDNLRRSPSIVNPTASSVVIRPAGGRDGVGHVLRARTASGFLGRNRVRRVWVSVSRADVNLILRDMTRAGVMAFFHKEGQRLIDARVRKALNKQRLVRRRRHMAAERARRSAERQNAEQIRRLQRMQKQSGESAREAYKRSQSKKRKHRRINRVVGKLL